MCASFVMNNIFRCEGKSVLGMLGIGTGGILNIILDPIFIFGLGLGTAGAAIATALEPDGELHHSAGAFLKGKSDVRLRITKVSKQLKTYVDIVTARMPTLLVAGSCQPGFCGAECECGNVWGCGCGGHEHCGKAYVFHVFRHAWLLGRASSLGRFQLWGKKYDRVHGTTRSTILVGTVVMAVFSLIIFISPRRF